MTEKKHTEPLKVGDRVVVYDDGRRLVGRIVQIGDSTGSTNIRVDGVRSQQCKSWGFGWFHPKQLRRLKKRPLRRVWIPKDAITQAEGCESNCIIAGEGGPWNVRLKEPEARNIPSGWTEFVEVKRG